MARIHNGETAKLETGSYACPLLLGMPIAQPLPINSDHHEKWGPTNQARGIMLASRSAFLPQLRCHNPNRLVFLLLSYPLKHVMQERFKISPCCRCSFHLLQNCLSHRGPYYHYFAVYEVGRTLHCIVLTAK